METISVTDAKSRFSELISRTSAGERFIIRRRERSMAVLINPFELEKMERASQAARHLALALGQDEALLGQIDRHETHPAMVAFGLWKDPSLDNFIDEVYESRQSAPNVLGWICENPGYGPLHGFTARYTRSTPGCIPR